MLKNPIQIYQITDAWYIFHDLGLRTEPLHWKFHRAICIKQFCLCLITYLVCTIPLSNRALKQHRSPYVITAIIHLTWIPPMSSLVYSAKSVTSCLHNHLCLYKHYFRSLSKINVTSTSLPHWRSFCSRFAKIEKPTGVVPVCHTVH